MPPQVSARFILFRVGDESFLLDIMGVRQILRFEGAMPVPRGPSFLEGLITFRGSPIPLVDLASRLFPGSVRPAEARPVVMVVTTDTGEVGLKVDEIRRILGVELDSIQPPPDLVRGMAGRLFFGVVESGEGLYLLIDLQSILSAEEKQELRAMPSEDAAGKAEKRDRPDA